MKRRKEGRKEGKENKRKMEDTARCVLLGLYREEGDLTLYTKVPEAGL